MASAQIRKIQKYVGATVGPEKPNGAVSPYFSGIILEPLLGTQVYQHVHCERNERIAANWVGGAPVDRALTLGGGRMLRSRPSSNSTTTTASNPAIRQMPCAARTAERVRISMNRQPNDTEAS